MSWSEYDQKSLDDHKRAIHELESRRHQQEAQHASLSQAQIQAEISRQVDERMRALPIFNQMPPHQPQSAPVRTDSTPPNPPATPMPTYIEKILPALKSAMTPEQLKHVQTSLGLLGFQLGSKEAVISSLTKSFIEFLETSDGREWLQIGVNVFFGTGSSANKEEEKTA